MKLSRKNIKQWYSSLNFQKKLLSFCIIVWVLPVFVMQSISVSVSIVHLNEQIEELTKNNLNQISERFSLTLESYRDVVYQIYADETIVENLIKYSKANERERAAIFFEVNERIKQFVGTKKSVRSISLICKDGESITYDKQTDSALDNIWRNYEDLREIKPYRMIQEHSGIVLISTEQIIDNGERTDIFFLGKEIYDTKDLSRGPIAKVVMGIQEDVLSSICDMEENLEGRSVNFIADAEGKIVSFPQKDYIGELVDGREGACALIRQTGMFSGKELGSSSYVDEETGWTFYNVYDKEYIMRPVSNMLMMYVFWLIIAFILIAVFMRSANRSFTVQLNEIIKGIHQVEKGNFDVVLEVNTQDEFGQIGQHFNSMTQRVKTLVAEMQEISEKKSQAEIRALESQINPHFLYNTLDAINWLAIGKGEYEISTMLGNLGVILRYTMRQSNGLASIAEVEDWLKSYVELYQLRYNNSFCFKMYVEPEVREVKIYKLLLQPILENAILHGIKDVENGVIQVDVGWVEESSKVYIAVEDNGVGMDESLVNYYNSHSKEYAEKESIGMANVFERISLYYGKEGNWHISSVKGKGTIVELTFPSIIQKSEGRE
ncbi:MAG: histidine kinase [Lachnospiraceae bacterium]|nr:histidine kinase [Lachnospiraceae bacterium]